MRFLPLNQLPLENPDLEFRESSLTRLFGAAVCAIVGILATLLALGDWQFLRIPLPVSIVFAAVLLLMSMFLFIAFRQTRMPSNWLLRTKGNLIYVKFRSFTNRHYPETDLQVIEINHAEIASVRVARIKLNYSSGVGEDGETNTETTLYLDITVNAPDLAELAELLTQERLRAPVGRIVKHRTFDVPVQLIEGNILRLQWRSAHSVVTPSMRHALNSFQSWTTIQVPHFENRDYRLLKMRELEPAEQHRLLRELHSLRPLPARLMASRLFKMNHSDVAQFLESRGDTRNLTPPAPLGR